MLLRQRVRLFKEAFPWARVFRAHLHLHEYEAKNLLKMAHVDVQPFVVVDASMDRVEAESIVKTLAAAYPNDALVVKAQVLAGGRGKGRFPESGLHGGVKVMVAKSVDIQKETYLAIVLDRRTRSPMLICSPIGGIDIEKVAAENPEAILAVPLDGADTPIPMELICRHLGLPEVDVEIHRQIAALIRIFFSSDALQVEINPLAMLTNGKVMAIDSKIEIDDAALFRQRGFSTASTQDKREAAASALALSFVNLSGTVGSLVNGAGLAMATMDLIKEFNGSAANFLDVGGSASASQVAGGLHIIASDPNVRAIFVNIFGGIMRCDTVASGLISAYRLLEQKGIVLPPTIVRLAGTRLEEATALIKDSGLPFLFTTDLSEGARLAVAAATRDTAAPAPSFRCTLTAQQIR
ncbi:succinate-CoA ligase [Mitosporidium daphniae]|uniref:Succinyl-CoA synthetase beta chain n=1 Tax=Mitosporidium daphniae TaxID=1485682 RepID=A0A098VVN1_9MICR|nr:succinate-CoA ligase [Mitosporidium daphniae]KGG52975.1 succinate-CoA ligase [Mitosporidium daphniae]|eukprot:XP_013239402.1 succinate-CoA ligase [Mitosporidium daphniae]